LSPLLLFSPFDETKGRKHGELFRKEAATKSEFLVNLKKLREVEDDPFPPDLLHFIDR